jgi:ATP-binding cassette subfamily B (MDR/TAP) protein 1
MMGDRIVVVSDGKVKEHGTFAGLASGGEWIGE